MNLKIFGFALGLAGLGLVVVSSSAQALTWKIGTDNAPNYGLSSHSFFGQQFRPNYYGPSGSGTASSTRAYLNSFSFYTSNTPLSSGSLYVFSSPYNGTPSNLATTTNNLVGASTSTAYNSTTKQETYTFNQGLLLAPSTTYYAYSNVNFGPGSLQYYYPNNYLPQLQSTTASNVFYQPCGGCVATRFSASFSDSATAVPFDFSPEEGFALGIPLFLGLRILKKKIGFKASKSQVTGTIS